jgi:hypothetical protein
MNKATEILKKLGTLKCDFSDLEIGDLSDIKSLYTCTKCGNDEIQSISFQFRANDDNIYRFCNKCKFEENCDIYGYKKNNANSEKSER